MNDGVKYTINPLFDFQILCDTDIGLYRLIKREYYDKSIFRKELFETNDETFIKAELLARKYFNPLFIFCKKNALKEEEMDDLYKQFLDEEYDKILELSIPNTIMTMASTANSTNKIVSVHVLCKSQKEVDWIHKYNHKLQCIIDDYENFDISIFDTIYIKDLYNLLIFNQKSINKKNIIFASYKFNMENTSYRMQIPIIEVTKNFYKDNKFMTIDPYKDINIPVDEML